MNSLSARGHLMDAQKRKGASVASDWQGSRPEFQCRVAGLMVTVVVVVNRVGAKDWGRMQMGVVCRPRVPPVPPERPPHGAATRFF